MYLYRKKPTTSQNQLRQDFGEYPPYPLKRMNKDISFEILSLGGVAEIYFTLSRNLNLISSQLGSPPRDDTPDFTHEFRKSWTEFRHLYRKKGLFFKILFIFLMTLSLPILTIVLITYIARMEKMGEGSLGFYAPLHQDTKEIVIRPWKINKLKNSRYKNYLESIVSHEHIHLLQDQFFSRLHTSEEETKNLKTKFSGLLNESDFNSGESFYYLRENEIEARLHEIVISFYNEFKHLPTNHDEFLCLILGSELLGNYVSKLLTLAKIKLPDKTIKHFTLRCQVPAADIVVILSLFKNHEQRVRFIFEAISVMYGNLIILYGDSETASKYFTTINCTDFYGEIYGE